MSSLNISLPKTLREYVEGQVENNGYTTPSEYVRTLIREDQKRKAIERSEGLLLEGIASGETVEVNRAFWEKRRATLLANKRKTRG